MIFSNKTIENVIKLGNVKSKWDLNPNKIVKNRKLMQRLKLVNFNIKNKYINFKKHEHNSHLFYTLEPKNIAYSTMVFYLHGGGYIYEITKAHWNLLIELCIKTNSKIIVPIYKLVPEYNKDYIFNEVYTLFKQTMPAEALPKIIMGDSAGGALGLATAILNREENITNINASILISPWLDIKMSTADMQNINKIDPMLDLNGILKCGSYYLKGSVDDIISSPLKANFEGLNNLSVFTGTKDILNPIAKAFKQKCLEQNIALNYVEYADNLHVFPLMPSNDGQKARNEIVALVEKAKQHYNYK